MHDRRLRVVMLASKETPKTAEAVINQGLASFDAKDYRGALKMFDAAECASIGYIW